MPIYTKDGWQLIPGGFKGVVPIPDRQDIPQGAPVPY